MTKKNSLLSRAAEEGEHSAIYCKLTFDAACLLYCNVIYNRWQLTFDAACLL